MQKQCYYYKQLKHAFWAFVYSVMAISATSQSTSNKPKNLGQKTNTFKYELQFLRRIQVVDIPLKNQFHLKKNDLKSNCRRKQSLARVKLIKSRKIV